MMTEQSTVVAGPGGADGGLLRVGIVAPPWIPVPPPAYGGTELVIDVLARGLAARGHEVVLFATGDSTCRNVKVAWHYEAAAGNGAIGSSLIELNHAADAYDVLAGCDVVHDHTLAGLFITQTATSMPTVATSHGPFDEPELANIYRRTSPVVPLIAISADQAASAASVGVAVSAVVHHGLDLDRYRYSPEPGDYFAVLTRMSPDKGIDRAVQVAREAGVELRIAAKNREPAEQAYYRQVIEPLLGGGVEFVGEVDHKAKVELLAGARALLSPVRWREPFGLANAEALACGTPVIGTDWGALPEIVAHGRTGYIAGTGPRPDRALDNSELVAAIGNIDRIDRAACRADAVQRFSMERMAAAHEAFYHQVIAVWPQPPAAMTW